MYSQLLYLSILVLCVYGRSNSESQYLRKNQALNSLRTAYVKIQHEDFIIGGSPARIEDFYWQVLLIYKKVPFCGGSIITATKIVTAAHCTFVVKNISQLSLRAGSSRPDAGGVLVAAKKIYENPNFNRPSVFNNDIAVILLRDALVFGPTIGAISIGNIDPPTNAMVTVSGFGSTKINENRTSDLHSVNVNVVEHKVCVKNYLNYPGKGKVTNNMLCAGLIGVGGKDACSGDSGG